MTSRRIRGAIIACLAGFTSVVALAQPAEGRHGPPEPPTSAQIQSLAGIDAARAEKVAAILKAMHKQQEETHDKLAAILSRDEMRKLHEAMRPGGGGPGAGAGAGAGAAR
jgi:hypothetical protein